MNLPDQPAKALHARLVGRQSDAELERKAKKSRRRGWFTQEIMDAAVRRAAQVCELIGWK